MGLAIPHLNLGPLDLSVERSESEVMSDSATAWTVAHQAPPSMEFSRQQYWSGLPFPSLGDLPDSGMEPRSPTLQAAALSSEPPGKPQCGEFSLNTKTLKK